MGPYRIGGSAAFRGPRATPGPIFGGGGVSRSGRTYRPDLHGGHELLMALPARNHRISRRDWLLAGLAIPLFRARANEQLSISFDGDNLHVAAPGLHFLAGKPLSRLKDADTVTFLSQLTLFSDPFVTVVKRAPERVVVSYDLWEERFAVTILSASKRTQSGLTVAQAEAWTIDNL